MTHFPIPSPRNTERGARGSAMGSEASELAFLAQPAHTAPRAPLGRAGPTLPISFLLLKAIWG